MRGRLLGPDGQPLPIYMNGSAADMSADAVHQRFWNRHPEEYAEAAQRMIIVTKALGKAGMLNDPLVESLRVATLLLAEVYIARRETMLGRQ